MVYNKRHALERGFPGGAVRTHLSVQVDLRDVGSISGWRISGGGHGNSLQYYLPGKFHGWREAWWATQSM